MFTRYRTEGIVLKAEARGEADILFTFYTRDFGRLEAMGRSIRKSNSKLKPNVSLFSYTAFEFIQGRRYNILTDATLLSGLGNAKKSLSKLSLLYKISETMEWLVRGEVKDEKVFTLLFSGLEYIGQTDLSKKELKIFYCFFTFRLLSLLGLAPCIKNCVICGKEGPGEGYFDGKEGGVICKNCFSDSHSGIYVENTTDLCHFFDINLGETFQQDPQFLLIVLKNYLANIS